MALRASVRPARRPVYIASYEGTVRPPEPTHQRAEEEVSPPPPDPDPVDGPAPPLLRRSFPAKDTEAHGGRCDGYCFRITFAAGKLERSYTMVRAFLVEHGYGGVPLPADVGELRAFRLPPKLRHQLSLFGEDGYVHNPLKILFPPKGGKAGSLILELYHEQAPNHLLRFHQRLG